MINQERLFSLLSRYRGEPVSTKAFMAKWFDHWTTLAPECDNFGNFKLTVGSPEDSQRILFTAHTDTVDPSTIPATKKKTLVWTDATKTAVGISSKSLPGTCLGADDGAGCELLVVMAEAGIPGTYIWFAEEEGGCIGSLSWLRANKIPFDIVVSFDRKGTTDVITSQRCQTCCSPEFENWLCKQLGPQYKGAPGFYTDSATFMDIVPECTNVSIGYANAHTSSETLDLVYLNALSEVLLKVPWDKAPVTRDPDEYSWAHDTQEDSLWNTLILEDSEWLRKALIQYGILDSILEEYSNVQYRVPRMRAKGRSRRDLPEMWDDYRF